MSCRRLVVVVCLTIFALPGFAQQQRTDKVWTIQGRSIYHRENCRKSSLCDVALAQAVGTPAAPSDVQKSFETLKTLAGNWQGPVTVDNPQWATDKPLSIAMRVASEGTAMIHELMGPRTPEVTMFYVDGDHLTLVHYCDYRNRARMVARPSTVGNKIEFDLVEIAGIDAPGHVTGAVFTIIENNHHTEEWTFAIPGKKPFHAFMDLKRVQ